MIRVKFISKAPASKPPVRFLNMFPDREARWGDCVFSFDPYNREYDWLVVYDDLPSKDGERFTMWEEELACPRSQTLLITSEPSSVKTYGSGFARQFGYVLTSQECWALRHPNRVYSQPGLVWFYGEHGPGASFDHVAGHLPEGKTKDLSTVCSTKKQKHTLHNRRLAFTREMMTRFPNMDVFGHGFDFVKDKAVALDSYCYHIAIENHYGLHHWTEKLADAYLGLCLPLYYGCPNLSDYYPEESFIRIDIFDVQHSASIIEKAVRDDEYSKRLPAIKEARRLYLERYFTFANVAMHVSRLHAEAAGSEVVSGTICSRHAWRRKSLLNALGFACEKFYVSTRNRSTKGK